MTSILYRIFNFAICSSTAQNRYIFVILTLLMSMKDVVDKETVESALQQCYLDASRTVSQKKCDVANFKSNFVALVKLLSENGVIDHVPSFNKEKKEEVKEEKKEVKEEAKVAKQGVDPALEKRFLAVLSTNLLGDELTEKVKEAGLPQEPRRRVERASL